MDESLLEPRVAQPPRSLFNGFGGLAGCRVGAGFGCSIDAGLVEWNLQPLGEIPAKLEIVVGFFAAQAVMQVGCVKHQAQFSAPRSESAQQSSTESAPPERPTPSRMPGLNSEVSRGVSVVEYAPMNDKKCGRMPPNQITASHTSRIPFPSPILSFMLTTRIANCPRPRVDY